MHINCTLLFTWNIIMTILLIMIIVIIMIMMIITKWCLSFATGFSQQREKVEELLAQNVQGWHMKIAFSNNEFKELFVFQNIMWYLLGRVAQWVKALYQDWKVVIFNLCTSTDEGSSLFTMLSVTVVLNMKQMYWQRSGVRLTSRQLPKVYRSTYI